ncbi:MAG: NAD(P)/FAD-dependent oxidoreductase [Chitinophagaceae bacterium]|nr:NAD(P)/FAD-dependent oxidoreductase [Chitinophagaceae bacterium]
MCHAKTGSREWSAGRTFAFEYNNSTMKEKKKIILIGGGFAGIEFVKKIDSHLFDVLLIDKINHHQFQPLFYQVATSQIEPASISFPFRNIFKHKKNLQIRLAEVIEVNDTAQLVITTVGEFRYDYLVIAIGCKTNFFGNQNIAKYSFTLKTTYDSIAIRNHILQTFENIISAEEHEKENLMNLVIVGAGPTGVELAGAFAEIKKNILPKDYPGIDFTAFKIILVEGSKHTLNNMSAQAKEASRNYLLKMGVQIITEVFVKDYDGQVLQLSNGSVISSATVIWAAGVTGNVMKGLPPENIIQGNRIQVNRINQMLLSERIFALGDIAYMETPLYPKGHPQVANVAINQAKNLANNFKRIALQRTALEFEYKDLGSMATIGRNKAVVDLSFVKFKGYIAWLVWMFLHLMLILSVRNKLIIFINWSWAYITKDTSLRFILKHSDKK